MPVRTVWQQLSLRCLGHWPPGPVHILSTCPSARRASRLSCSSGLFRLWPPWLPSHSSSTSPLTYGACCVRDHPVRMCLVTRHHRQSREKSSSVDFYTKTRLLSKCSFSHYSLDSMYISNLLVLFIIYRQQVSRLASAASCLRLCCCVEI